MEKTAGLFIREKKCVQSLTAFLRTVRHGSVIDDCDVTDGRLLPALPSGVSPGMSAAGCNVDSMTDGPHKAGAHCSAEK